MVPVICLGQDFMKVVKIVGEMEESLKGMISKESAERKAQMDALKSDMADLRKELNTQFASTASVERAGISAASSDILVKRVEALELKVGELQKSPDVLALTGQLNTLVVELKKVMTEYEPSPLAALEKKVDGLAQENADLKKLVEAQKKAATPAYPLIKVGLLAQFHAQAVQEQPTAIQSADPTYTQHWQRQVYLRRFRVLVGGNVTEKISYFFESDAPNIGKVGPNGAKSSTVTMYVQDAQVQHTFMPELSLIAGLQLVSITRNGIQSAASLMALNYGSYQFIASGPLDNSVGRDVGFNLRGFLFDQRLEYRSGIFSGRNINLYTPLRFTSRFQYCFKDREKGFFYTGTALGKGEFLNLGGGVDIQGSYVGLAADGFLDTPTGELGSVTVSLGYSFYNGGGSDQDSTFMTGRVPRQHVLFGEVGYLFKEYNVQPYVKYESQAVRATVLKQVGANPGNLDLQNQLRSSSRYGVGVNYFLAGHQASVKALWEGVQYNRLTSDKTSYESASANEFTVQLQYFMF
jgi:hypothetical protein